MKTQYIRLAGYGRYRHVEGVQNFTFESAHVLTKNFNSVLGKLARKWKGVPIFVGHPDDPKWRTDFLATERKSPDSRAYGSVIQLDPRPDGLWVQVKWEGEGLQLIRNRAYQYFSPRWLMKKNADLTFQPRQLLSLGLTNNPNIPCDPIPVPIDVEEILPRLAQTLSIPAESSPSTIIEAIQKATDSAQKFSAENAPLKQHNHKLQSDLNSLLKLASEHEKQLQQLSQELISERKFRVQKLLESAVSDGRIPPESVANWKKAFESNPQETLHSLANSKPVIKTSAITQNLRHSNPYNSLISNAHQLMDQTGQSFMSAWTSVKSQCF